LARYLGIPKQRLTDFLKGGRRMPDAETMRGKLKLPTPEEQAQIDAHKRKLQAEMDAARLAREARL
jgi:hypothetical protein